MWGAKSTCKTYVVSEQIDPRPKGAERQSRFYYSDLSTHLYSVTNTVNHVCDVAVSRDLLTTGGKNLGLEKIYTQISVVQVIK